MSKRQFGGLLMSIGFDVRSAGRRVAVVAGPLMLAAVAVLMTGDDAPRIDPATGKTVPHCSQCGASLDGSTEFCTVCSVEVSGGEDAHEGHTHTEES